MSKAKTQVEIGQVYAKIGAPRPQWRVAKIIQHREGPHALLVSLDGVENLAEAEDGAKRARGDADALEEPPLAGAIKADRLVRVEGVDG